MGLQQQQQQLILTKLLRNHIASLVSRFPVSHGLRSTAVYQVGCYVLQTFTLLLRLAFRVLSWLLAETGRKASA